MLELEVTGPELVGSVDRVDSENDLFTRDTPGGEFACRSLVPRRICTKRYTKRQTARTEKGYDKEPAEGAEAT